MFIEIEDSYELTNLYCRGYLISPLVETLTEHGLFELLDGRSSLPPDLLARELGANEGYFRVAMQALTSLDWTQTDQEGRYSAGRRMVRLGRSIVSPLYAIEPLDLHQQQAARNILSSTLDRTFESGKSVGPQQDPFDGAVLVTLAASLQGSESSIVPLISSFQPHHAQTLLELFAQNGWLVANRSDLSTSGKAFIKNPRVRLAALYRPILKRVPALIFGDAQKALREIAQETSLTWGNTSVNRSIFTDIHSELDEGLDGLEVELRTWKTVSFDHGYGPLAAGLAQSLAFTKRSTENNFHLCGSLIPDTLLRTSNEALRLLSSEQLDSYLDNEGQPVDALTVFCCWQQRLHRLAQQIDQSRVLVLQEHSPHFEGGLPADAGFPEFSHIDRLVHEYPISADAFLTIAASVGLFADGFRWFPKLQRPCRISLISLVRRDYVVRQVTEEDLDRLWQLEKLCWQHTRSEKDQILLRLQRYPIGQYVLEREDQVVGVIYSQRIENVDALFTSNASNVHMLHRADGPVLQLLAINIDPEAQSGGLGNRLLEFMLQRASLLPGVQQIVGVTLCKNYRLYRDVPFEDYIQRQDSERDPVLTFHHSHGAKILRAVPGYRPEDSQNLANGVLVAYDPLTRKPRRRGGVAMDRVNRIDEESVMDFALRESAALLGCVNVDIDRPLMEMGLDSVDLLKLQGQVEDRFHLRIEPDFFFRHSTVRKVVRQLEALLIPQPQEDAKGMTVTPDSESKANLTPEGIRVVDTDIAIIGMACKLPGGIENPEQLWQVLVDAECVVEEYPEGRGFWPAGKGIEHGGFVHDVDAFDAAFFRISPIEAEMMDPQQRILLQVAWACLEDAGVRPSVLKSSSTGVFLGASNLDYGRLIQEAGIEIEAHHGVGNSLAVLANRLSYFFDLSGPSLLIDTACSSSLVAIHTALLSLRAGQCSAALVGGVNVICHPGLSIAYQKAGMLAPDGQCKVFDAMANGYVRSEGAVIFLIKPLSAALAAGDQVHAVIKGGATNHGGLAAGLTVPNPEKQGELLTAAWRDAGIGAHELTYIEAHGTGTPLGDPIEIQGIKMAYAVTADMASVRPCAIASVKGNLGHLESAAGALGLLKVILSLQHQQIPASILWQELNPKIELRDTPFFIPRRISSWASTRTRLAAVSSFGSGGANAHVVVQEYPRPAPTSASCQKHLFVLSANTEVGLRAYARQTVALLERASTEADWEDAIYTWQVGRTVMKHRLAARVANRCELIALLLRWLAEEVDIDCLWYGKEVQDVSLMHSHAAKLEQKAVYQAMRVDDLQQLGVLWTSGREVDWYLYYDLSARKRGHRISLPTYPFAKTRFWIHGHEDQASKSMNKWAAGSSFDKSTFLLARDISPLSEIRFSGNFTGAEFFLSDHRVQMRRVMPAACYIEMARAAAVSLNKFVQDDSVLLTSVSWISPIVADTPITVHLEIEQTKQNDIPYEIYSHTSSETEVSRKLVHGRGRICLYSPEKSYLDGYVDWRRLKANCVQSLESVECYRRLNALDLSYGASLRSIDRVHIGIDRFDRHFLLAEIAVPVSVQSIPEQFGLHPSFLDGALQAAILLLQLNLGGETDLSLPFELQQIWVSGRTPVRGYAYLRGGTAHDQDKPLSLCSLSSLDIDLCDESGFLCARLKGFVARKVKLHLNARPYSPIEPCEGDPLSTTTLLSPVWDAVALQKTTSWPVPGAKLLLIGASAEELALIKGTFSCISILGSCDDLDILTESPVEHILWFVPTSKASGVADELLILEQNDGVRAGFPPNQVNG